MFLLRSRLAIARAGSGFGIRRRPQLRLPEVGAASGVRAGSSTRQDSGGGGSSSGYSSNGAADACGGFGLAALSAATLFGFQSAWTKCEESTAKVPKPEVKLVTYNILSPPLGRASYYSNSRPEDCDPKSRLPKVLKRMEEATAAGRVIALQEVDLGWAGKLHAFFAERDYCVVFGQYGSSFSGYMGVMLAWPRHAYEVIDVEISRISDTAPKEMWPKDKLDIPSHFGMLSRHELQSVIGCYPPEFEAHFDEWKVARGCMNEAVFVKLCPRGLPTQSFVVSTYHMPCLFGSAAKVRVMNIHLHLLMGELRKFAKGHPAVLMGDFNIKPDDSAYRLACSGGDLNALAATWPEEIKGLVGRLPDGQVFPGGLQSAYQVFHGKEPLFTNFAQTSGQSEPFCETLDYIWFTPGRFAVTACPALPQSKAEVDGPFPSKVEPSDHIPLLATLQLN